jgi:excisionase family DNA binding protein
MNVPGNILQTRARLLTVEQAAGILAVSKRTLERLIACGEFPHPLKIGRSSRVTSEDVDKYLERLQLLRPVQKESK